MQQRDRRTNEPAYVRMQRVVDIGLAAVVLKRVLIGEPVTIQQERVALAIYNKTVPSLQAISMQLETVKPNNINDIRTMLLSNGVSLDVLAPEPAAIESPEKKEESPAIAPDPGTPE